MTGSKWTILLTLRRLGCLPSSRKHVFSDLQPYVCMLEHWKSPGTTFSKRRDLMKHEMQDHQLCETFYRCIFAGCEAKLKDLESVYRHQLVHSIASEAIQSRLSPGGIPSNDLNENLGPLPRFFYPGACNNCEDSFLLLGNAQSDHVAVAKLLPALAGRREIS